MMRFTEQLRRLDDAQLTPYQFRLLIHYWRVGRCWETIRTTAAKCGMSVGQVSQVRRWLLDQGWIAWESVLVGGKRRQAIVLCSLREEGSAGALPGTGAPDGEEAEHRSRGERKPSPHERQNRLTVRPVNAILNEPNVSNGSKEVGMQTARRSDSALPEPDLALAEMVNALAAVTGLDSHHFWHELSGNGRELLAGGYTAAQVRTFFGRAGKDPTVWNWYKHDWRGDKGTWPSLKAIWERIAGAKRWRPEEEQQDWLSGIAVFEE